MNFKYDILLEFQSLKEKHKKFVNWLEDRIKCEMRTHTKIENNTVKMSESDEMNVYLDVLKKFRSIIDE